MAYAIGVARTAAFLNFFKEQKLFTWTTNLFLTGNTTNNKENKSSLLYVNHQITKLSPKFTFKFLLIVFETLK